MNTASHVILVVDDDEAVRHFIEVTLQAGGYTVVTAKNGAEAVRALEEQTFSLVVSDLMMPRMNGSELASYVRQHTATPVLLMSGNLETAQISAALVEVDAFLPKPVSVEDLLGTVAALLGSR